jgi:hypothetical protein
MQEGAPLRRLDIAPDLAVGDDALGFWKAIDAPAAVPSVRSARPDAQVAAPYLQLP